MIKKPMKAPSRSITNEQLELLEFPQLGSFKLDGYRCTTHNAAYTSSMKLVTNNFIQGILSQAIYNHLDGELIVGPPNSPDAYNNTTGAVRRSTGEPDFTFYVFDYLNLDSAYKHRYEYLKLFDTLKGVRIPHLKVLPQRLLNSVQEVLEFEKYCIEEGYEGAMIRSPEAYYKQGRCTLREGNIFKRKPREDDEGIIIGFKEELENMNETFTNELGNSARSSHQENKVGKGTLGAVILLSKLWKEPIVVGTGEVFTKKMRQYIWDHRAEFLGSPATYSYQAYGSIDAPRQAALKGLRDIADMTKY